MDERLSLALPPTGSVPTVEVAVTPAAAGVLAAWDADSRAKAVHEAGHVLVARALGVRVSGADIARRHGGRTYIDMDAEDQPATVTTSMAYAQVAAALGGWAAEREVLGETTLGCQSDMRTATGLVYEMLEAGAVDGAPMFGRLAVAEALLPAPVLREWGASTRAPSPSSATAPRASRPGTAAPCSGSRSCCTSAAG
jgi:Peptidase family M41